MIFCFNSSSLGTTTTTTSLSPWSWSRSSPWSKSSSDGGKHGISDTTATSSEHPATRNESNSCDSGWETSAVDPIASSTTCDLTTATEGASVDSMFPKRRGRDDEDRRRREKNESRPASLLPFESLFLLLLPQPARRLLPPFLNDCWLFRNWH